MSKDNGGPAFPTEVRTAADYGRDFDGLEMKPNTTTFYQGISMRDYFAAKATDRDVDDVMNRSSINLTRTEARYIHADNMLLERNK